ncbi:MAG: hypothetical protein ABL921_11095 [Pirellula sp.]
MPFRSLMYCRNRRSGRQGSFSMEVVISATILLAAVGIMGAMIPRIGRLWRESRNYQLASHELANRLEYLTGLHPDKLDDEIAALAVSDELKDELMNAELSAETMTEEFGTRIRLSIRWDRGPDSHPVSMIGWRPQKHTASSYSSDTEQAIQP